MPIVFIQGMIIIVLVLVMMIVIDLTLGKVVKNWKPLPWEEDEGGHRTNSDPTRKR